MKLYRFAAIPGVLVASALVLAACGSDDNSDNPGTNSSSASASDSSSSGSSGSTGDQSGSTTGIKCATGTLQLAGSTAQANAISAWTKAYQTACKGATINNAGGGSGQGVQNFTDGTIDFAGSDAPLAKGSEHDAADKRCKAGPAIDLPMVPGPIAVGYNLPGVKELNLSAGNLAKIFSGKITKWNDDAIKKDNPDAKLPSASIATFHRSDGSGTSFNFSNYLSSEAKSDWSYGANKQWPAPGGQGQKGTAGIAQGVKTTPGGIGYMELSYATQNKISYAKVSNAKGDFVELTTDNVVNFLSKATSTGTGDDMPLTFPYSTAGADAYPNLLVTYEIVCSKGNDAKKLPLLKNFLSYIASDAGQAILPDNGYVKLPTNIQKKVQKAIDNIS